MSQGNLKNMVVLKNLPSNIVEEAIVILKSNKKIRQVEKIEKNNFKENSGEKIFHLKKRLSMQKTRKDPGLKRLLKTNLKLKNRRNSFHIQDNSN